MPRSAVSVSKQHTEKGVSKHASDLTDEPGPRHLPDTPRERLCPDHPLSPPQGTVPENTNVVPLLLGQHLSQGVCIGWAGGPAWNNAHLSHLDSLAGPVLYESQRTPGAAGAVGWAQALAVIILLLSTYYEQ